MKFSLVRSFSFTALLALFAVISMVQVSGQEDAAPCSGSFTTFSGECEGEDSYCEFTSDSTVFANAKDRSAGSSALGYTSSQERTCYSGEACTYDCCAMTCTVEVSQDEANAASRPEPVTEDVSSATSGIHNMVWKFGSLACVAFLF